jgi:hypothetical protein
MSYYQKYYRLYPYGILANIVELFPVSIATNTDRRLASVHNLLM